jgi:phosphate starvation-inducible protein PhoH
MSTNVVNALDFTNGFISKKEMRLLKKNKKKQRDSIIHVSMNLKEIHPKTTNQELVFSEFNKSQNLILHGVAGTGKTFLSIYLSLKEILNNKNSPYKKLIIVRSVVPTRDMGFLPGSQKEKMRVYEAPYHGICAELFGRGDAYEILKSKNIMEFISTSFIRGITLNNSIIVVDEVQNLDFGECDSIITRIGRDSKILFSGDFRQCDLTRHHERSGLLNFMKVLKSISEFSTIEFTEGDIVRSNLVKSYIISKLNHEILV